MSQDSSITSTNTSTSTSTSTTTSVSNSNIMSSSSICDTILSDLVVPLKKQIVDIFNDYNKWLELGLETSYSVQTTIHGWVRDFRPQSDNIFITLTDGSTTSTLQIFVNKQVLANMNKPEESVILDVDDNTDESKEKDKESLENIRGACIKVEGRIVKSPAKGQAIELVAEKITLENLVKDKKSILMSKKVNLETLRKYQHMRSRFRSYGWIYKIRSTLLKNIHEFFHANNFYNLDPNVITTSDCEGAGEVFTISSLNFDDIKKKFEKEDSDKLDQTKFFSDDFFEKQAFLTVSSQLQLEALASGLSRVYTLNPSFRAERSRTKRHLGCFTHLEWEIAFIDLTDLMNFSENLIKYVIGKTLKDCESEYNELDSFLSKGIKAKLNGFINTNFERISYTKAIELIETNKKHILKKFSQEGMTIKDIPVWGDDLGSFCERYICEEIYKKPTFIFNYPKVLKSFYMKVNDDNTVQACDLVVPQLGELIGSSIRENSWDKLNEQMELKHMDKSKLDWYIDLRCSGGSITGGAGLGFDRLVNVCTLMDGNIRDVVPFPVSYQECDY